MNTASQVLGNSITILVVALVFYWIYKKMPDNKFKNWISEKFRRGN